MHTILHHTHTILTPYSYFFFDMDYLLSESSKIKVQNLSGVSILDTYWTQAAGCSKELVAVRS